jgi:hypothetical protein
MINAICEAKVKPNVRVSQSLKHARMLPKFAQPLRFKRELNGVLLCDGVVSDRTAPKRRMIDGWYP